MDWYLSCGTMKLYNLVCYLGKRKQATLNWAIPYAMAKFNKKVAEASKQFEHGSYFKIELNETHK